MKRMTQDWSNKEKRNLVIISAFVLILTFFIQVSPHPPLVSFSYFLDELKFIEETLDSIGFDVEEYRSGHFTLESVVDELGFRGRYLSHFESDIEQASLGSTPYIDFAFHDLSENPIRIWIDDKSYRIYSTGHDGESSTGGLDADDIWTGQPEKAREYIHQSYFDSWHEDNRRNLWVHLFECIKRSL